MSFLIYTGKKAVLHLVRNDPHSISSVTQICDSVFTMRRVENEKKKIKREMATCKVSVFETNLYCLAVRV